MPDNMAATGPTLGDQLSSIDGLPLECDGLTRVISTLMQRDGIPHEVHIGKLEIDAIGTIPFHWWIVLADDQVCDFRARMWLGRAPEVPHGVFTPGADQLYTVSSNVEPTSIQLSATLFSALVGKPLEAFPRLEQDTGRRSAPDRASPGKNISKVPELTGDAGIATGRDLSPGL